jgi:group I intron endonuclease
MGYIYKITNTVNKKIYIGQTKLEEPELRWKKHLWAIYAGTGCPVLAKAVKKYGKDKFTFEVLIICFDESRYEMEKLYIKKYNSLIPNGYNIQEGGVQPISFAGRKHSQATKEIIGYKNSNVYKEIKLQEQLTNNENNKQKRCKMTDKTKESIRKSLIDYYKSNVKSSINRENISKKMSILRGRKIGKYSDNNILIAEYPTIIVAANENNLNANAIQQCAAGRSKTSGGFIWKYMANT